MPKDTAKKKPEGKGHLYLVDGSGFIFRAYYALPKMSRTDGTPVNAVFGFSTMLYKLLEDLADGAKPTHLAVVFDAARESFRNEIYPAYKAQRPDAPEDLIPQFELIREAVKAFNVPCIEMRGFEADDIIATYARLASEQGMKVTIVSSDKDLMQLVTDGVELYDSMKNRPIGPNEVKEKFGVLPEKVIDVQALAGDSVDNIPGVPGIGEKSATLLISEFGSLDALLILAKKPDVLRNDILGRQKRVESQIYRIVGHPFKINSKKELGQTLFEELKLPGGKKDDKGIYLTNNEILEKLASDGYEVSAKILYWRQIGRLTGDFSTTLATNIEQALLSRRLAKLKDDVPLKEPLTTFGVREPVAKDLFPFLDKMEFKSLKAKAQAKLGPAPETGGGEAAPSGTIDTSKYACVTDVKTLKNWVAKAREQGYVAVDTETTSLDPMRAALVGVSLALGPGEACYVPLRHRAGAGEGLDLDGKKGETIAQIPPEAALKELKSLLEDPAILKIGQNLKYDFLVFLQNGVELRAIDDTMLLSYALDCGLHGHGMDELSELHLGHKPISFKEVAGTGKAQVTFDYVPLDKATAYAAEDADVTLRLWKLLKPRLVKEGLTAVYETLERPLIPVLARMEEAGVKVDAAILKRLSNEFAERLAALETEIHKIAKSKFNIASPKQLGKILFEDMKLAGGRRGKSGEYSTDADTLEALAAEGHKLPAKILEWRQLAKLKSTYTDTLQNQVNPDTGRIHTSYALAATSTGRLASTDPNVQNIPIRTEEGRKIRTAFVAEKGNVLVSADYSQIELRLLAHLARIDALKEAFRKGLDIHAMTASEVFGVPIEGMDPMVRRSAKAINYGIIYGMSAFGLASQIGVSREEARAYMDAYFKRFPGIREYMETTKEFCRKHGFVTTLFGRRCFVRGITDKNPNVRGFSERAAINAPLQGSAADIIRRAMIRIPGALAEAKLKNVRMLLQVHDELVFEMPADDAKKAIPVIRETMEQAPEPAVRLDAPLTVECHAGKNWDEAH